ncbi:hypothetical protein FACS1894152_8390 [Bacilli bacterium]|nr:hypothetical protein FACS1894152_8390 [Bacilli bacterium]
MEQRIKETLSLLNEKQKRLYLANEAKAQGRGGISKVSKISKVSRTTIRLGSRELESGETIDTSRVRRVGGGRKSVEHSVPGIKEKIQEIVDGNIYGDPEKVICWTTVSLRKIQALLLEKYGIKVGFRTVGTILEDMGYSKQINQKMLQVGRVHPHRNEQFEFIDTPFSVIPVSRSVILANAGISDSHYYLMGSPHLRG